MIDRIWRLWRLRHPTAGVPPDLLAEALAWFDVTVARTINVNTLGSTTGPSRREPRIGGLLAWLSPSGSTSWRRDLPELPGPTSFYRLDHSGPSYQVRVFFNNPSAGPDTPSPREEFVSKFSCSRTAAASGRRGTAGPAAVSPFDRRQPHQLVPIARYLTVTGAIRDLIGRDQRSVTVRPSPSSARPAGRRRPGGRRSHRGSGRPAHLRVARPTGGAAGGDVGELSATQRCTHDRGHAWPSRAARRAGGAGSRRLDALGQPLDVEGVARDGLAQFRRGDGELGRYERPAAAAACWTVTYSLRRGSSRR